MLFLRSAGISEMTRVTASSFWNSLVVSGLFGNRDWAVVVVGVVVLLVVVVVVDVVGWILVVYICVVTSRGGVVGLTVVRASLVSSDVVRSDFDVGLYSGWC